MLDFLYYVRPFHSSLMYNFSLNTLKIILTSPESLNSPLTQANILFSYISHNIFLFLLWNLNLSPHTIYDALEILNSNAHAHKLNKMYFSVDN
jgi:hypothetical protein